ncbi:hypothetical protein [Bartonella schoenbuchensis]|uniref:Right handed beta helix region n=1 Tax=Bartonella schoenbuchensis (strain DSM 13525 / NCTC 13165 / R1) TaxID=687861 RepID=A0A1S6XNH4_BARSR|nr:hypothetical protein [Bartonella schoenbuchensis]AQX30162.1 hypothetical protein BscR1v2_002070 [Bartonella schoenbuchensis R1]
MYAKGGTNLTMTLDKVEIKGVEMGVYMEKEGKSLTIRGNSTIEFKENGIGVGVWGKVESVNLNDVTIKGEGVGSMGVYVGVYTKGTGNGTVALEDVRISKVGTGVRVEGRETLTITKGSVDFTGNNGVGVYLGSLVTKASLKGTTITGQNKGTGVYAVGGRGMGS